MDEHEDKSKKQEYEYRRKSSEDIAYPHNYIAGRGRGGFGGCGAFLFRRRVVWDLASMQSPQKPPQKAEDARHEKPRHGKNRSNNHKGKVIAAGWSGKVKTAVTMTGICIMLFLNTSVFADLLGLVVLHAVNWCVIAAVSLTTLYSGIEYFIQNRSVFEN